MYHLPSNRASKKERQGSSMRQGLNIVTMVLGAVVAAAGMATAILSIINISTDPEERETARHFFAEHAGFSFFFISFFFSSCRIIAVRVFFEKEAVSASGGLFSERKTKKKKTKGETRDPSFSISGAFNLCTLWGRVRLFRLSFVKSLRHSGYFSSSLIRMNNVLRSSLVELLFE